MGTSSVVIAFGRFNPPTTGHGKLVDFVQREADRRRADAIIFPSQTEKERKKNPKNPLPFREKVDFLRQFFPRMNWNANERVVTFFDALHMLSQKYDNVYMVAGSDRVAAFDALRKYIKPTGRKGGPDIVLKHFEVVPVPGERDPDADDVSGMSASKMRAAAVAGDWEAFRSGVPTRNVGLAKQLYQSVRRHMGLNESRYTPDAFLLYGYSQEQAEHLGVRVGVTSLAADEFERMTPLSRNVMEMSDPFMINMTGLSFSAIKRLHRLVESLGYAPTVCVYGRGSQPMTESRIEQNATSGLIQAELARDVVVLESEQKTFAYMASLLREAEGPATPKQPSEVDKLKDTQKQQTLLMKQRQAQDLLQAKQRELQKKSREDMNKISRSEKPRSITR